MGARFIVGGALALSLAVTLAFGACRHGQPIDSGPLVPATTVLPPAPQPPPSMRMPTPNDDATAALTPEQQLALDAQAARTCTSPITAIVNHPDGGVVFNNAMTSVDAGFIDRTQGVLDALAAQSDGLRCCFDAWLRAHPADEPGVMLRVTLAADGSVEDAQIDPARSTSSDPVTLACIAALARDVSYPASPTGKQTIVEYPIKVRAEWPDAG